MKILFLTSNDARTGGAITINRLHEALLGAGHDSRVFLGSDTPLNDREVVITRSLPWRIADRLYRRSARWIYCPDIYRPSFHLWKKAIRRFQPDLIHLHWTYGAEGSQNIPLRAFKWLSRRYPLVWTFHDMWGLTGGCTNSLDCVRWQAGCGDCPQLKAEAPISTISHRRDTTAAMWKIKKRVYGQTPFVVLCPSNWLTMLAAKSPLLVQHAVHHLPNLIDAFLFKPQPKQTSREVFGLPQDAFIILFVGKATSVFAYGDRIPVFIKVMRLLKERDSSATENVHVFIVGEDGDKLGVQLPFPFTACGRIIDQNAMAVAYSASDVFVHTTRYDNFPGVVQESLACGTPVIASDVGGVPDLVIPGQTGFLADANDADSFVDPLLRLMKDAKIRSFLADTGRCRVVDCYSRSVILPSVLALYAQEIESFTKPA